MDSAHGTMLTLVIGVLFPSQRFQLLVMFVLGVLHQQERRVNEIIPIPCHKAIQYS